MTDGATAPATAPTSGRRFPFPIPFGWFQVAMPDELPRGEVVSRHYFGHELAVWRDHGGEVHCHEAFCPHLGAHIGVGGTVEGDCVRCPFHGWLFDGEGTNVEIPYAGRTNRRARLRTFPAREHAGIVLAWYHPDGEGPLWEPMPVPEYDDPEYTPYRTSTFTIRTCMQELAENGFDLAHFRFVHGHPKAGEIETVEFDGYDRTMLSRQEFPSSKGSYEGRIDVVGRGPGFGITRYQALIDAVLVGTSTPIDEETTRLWFHFALRDTEGDERAARIADTFVESVNREVGQDIPIWENKRYVDVPALAEGEGPIMEYRRWFRQFYA